MKTLLISDVTLRALDTFGYSALSFKEKLETVKSLAELKADYIELPCAVGNKSDEVLVKTLCACVKGSGIAIETGVTENDVEKNFALISGANKKRLIVSLPVSPEQMEYQLSKKPKAVLELIKTLTEKAVSLTPDVEVSLLDATRAEREFLINAVSVAVNSGAKTVTLCDSVGAITPCELSELLEDLKAKIPELKTVTLGVSCSDEFSLAVANLLESVASGASLVKLSAIDAGSFPRFEKTLSALENLGGKKGFKTNINKTVVSRTVSHISAFLSGGKSVVFDATPSSDEVIPENVSVSALSKLVKSRGYDLGAEEIKTLQTEIKRLSEKKKVGVKELDVLISASVVQVPVTYELVNFSVLSSNVLTTTASITLKKDGKEISGLSYGNGSVDAAFLALENIVGRHFELDDFELGAVTEGKEAMGQAVVSLRKDGKLFVGRGVSTDIVGASIRAYLSALNKIVYEEQNK